MPYCTVLYRAVPYCTVLYRAVPYCTVQYCTAEHDTVRHWVVLYLVQVSDFGLSRPMDITKDVGKLPIKWMAPEAVKEHVRNFCFNSQTTDSDVLYDVRIVHWGMSAGENILFDIPLMLLFDMPLHAHMCMYVCVCMYVCMRVCVCVCVCL